MTDQLCFDCRNDSYQKILLRVTWGHKVVIANVCVCAHIHTDVCMCACAWVCVCDLAYWCRCCIRTGGSKAVHMCSVDLAQVFLRLEAETQWRNGEAQVFADDNTPLFRCALVFLYFLARFQYYPWPLFFINYSFFFCFAIIWSCEIQVHVETHVRWIHIFTCM